MPTLLEFATYEQMREEYQKSFLLNMFRKIYVKMRNDSAYKTRIQTLYRESYNKETTSQIIKREFNYDLSKDEAELLTTWYEAHFRKGTRRNPIPLSKKVEPEKVNVDTPEEGTTSIRRKRAR